MKIDIYYANICKHEHEKKWQGYDARSCLKLVLNKLKKMKGLIPIYTPLGTNLKEAFMCASSRKVSWEPFQLGVNWNLIKSLFRFN
jgi:hypothetical protein